MQVGELVAVPTETVYGLAGRYDDLNAIQKIYQTKNRPSYDPLILHIHSHSQLKELISRDTSDLEKMLIQEFWPGPLTFIFERSENVSDLITSKLPTVAIRMPRHPIFLDLLEKINIPLAAPSANPFKYISPTSAQHVAKQLGGKIPMILDGGNCEVGLESTIIKVHDEKIVVLRQGLVSIERLSQFAETSLVKSDQTIEAPGMLDAHYSPVKPFIKIKDADTLKGKSLGLIMFSEYHPDFPIENQIVMSPEKDLKIAAMRLYGAMREMDMSNFEGILIDEFPNEEMGRAINDRIKRALTRI